jgi:putative holliday junction resolvase
MKILGIDYGRKKIGLAVSEGVLSEPLKVLRVGGFEDAVEKVLQEIQSLKAENLIVGISEGEMGEESKEFAKRIGAKTFDETLSTHNAQELSRQANVPRKRRKDLEDAYAASVMLQNYLDSIPR